MKDRRQQVVGGPLFHHAAALAVLRRDIHDARCLHIGVDRLRDGVGHARHGKRGQRRARIVSRQRPHLGEAPCERIRNLARMAAGPDPRAVDAAAPAVDEHAFHHHIEVALPLINLVVAQEDFRESRAVRLHPGIAAIPVHGGRPAEDQASAAAVDDSGAHVGRPRVNRNRLARNARLEEGRRHPVRRPGLLRSRFQDETYLQRDDRQPECMDARRVRRQHEAEDGALRLVADGHLAFLAVPGAEHIEGEPPRQRRQDVPHLGEHERVLLHVRAAHPLGQAGARRLGVGKLVGALRAIAHRERRVHVELARPADARHQFVNRNLAQHLARACSLPHVALNQSAIRTADAGDGLAGRKVDDLVHIHARVWCAPPQDRNVDHRLFDSRLWSLVSSFCPGPKTKD